MDAMYLARRRGTPAFVPKEPQHVDSAAKTVSRPMLARLMH
jgi:hypothetical protein